MIPKIFYRYYPFRKHPKTSHRDPKTKTLNLPFTYIVIPKAMQTRVYVEGKDSDPKKTAKEEELTIKMPGFVHPDTHCEEGCFTQKVDALSLYVIRMKNNYIWNPGMLVVPWKTFIGNMRWYSKTKDGPAGGGAVRQSGGGFGKLDSANEDGFFYKLNKARLEKLKKLMNEKELHKNEPPLSEKPK